MNKSMSITGAIALLFCSSCSTLTESVTLGSVFGGSIGTVTGLIIEQSPGPALIGAGVGAIIGGTIFYLGHNEHERQLSLKSNQEGIDSLPSITAPDVICHDMDGNIEADGTKLVSPHTVCEIKNQSTRSE